MNEEQAASSVNDTLEQDKAYRISTCTQHDGAANTGLQKDFRL